MLYTRKGDDGTSGLFGTRERLPKNHPLYEALGTLDELGSLLGVCRAKAAKQRAIAAALFGAQQALFVVQAELAGADKALAQRDVEALEQTIADIEESLERKPHSFVVAGTTELEAYLDYARAVSRRAERAAVAAAAWRNLCPTTRSYLNRLSSLLYALAREAAVRKGVEEPAPTY